MGKKKTGPGHHDPEKRDYKHEYESYQGSKERRNYRNELGKERRKRKEEGRDPGDRHSAHKDNNPNNNSRDNFTTQSKEKNLKHAADKLRGRKIKSLRKSITVKGKA